MSTSQGQDQADPQSSGKWWLDEVTRGSKLVLVVMKGAFPRGSFEVDSIEEKTRWVRIVATLNST